MKKLFALLFIIITSYSSSGQISQESELYKTILSKDSLLFNIGFNTCDIKQFEKLLSTDFEFFHDTDSISNKTVFLRNLRKGLCGSPATYQSRRELIASSTEIYPLYKGKKLYGAIQNGVHKFYENIGGRPERFASEAKFTHVWLLVKGEWKLARSLSFDHQVGN